MRYRTLTEGLEVTEVRWKELERTKRLDAEFYSKENLRLISLVKRLNASPLPHFVRIADGNHTSISQYFADSGIPYYRGGDTCNPFIEFSPSPLRIPESIYQKEAMQRSHLRKGDILLSIVGTVGNVSQVTTDGKATCSCKLAILRPNEGQRAAYLATFLRSKYGQQQIEKFRRGSVQTGLILEDFDQLLVPVLGGDLQRQIDTLCSQSLEGIKRSNELYASAIAYLQERLGIAEFGSGATGWNIKPAGESFFANGRLDAEYYKPEYEYYQRQLESYPYGSMSLRKVCQIRNANYAPDRGKEDRYVELADIGLSGEIVACSFARGGELPGRARQMLHEGDVLVSSLEGSLESCALVTQEYDGALCSTGFHVLRSEVLNPETLLILFKSTPLRQLMRRGCTGTILTAIARDELGALPIPLVARAVQEEIAKRVRESASFRQEALRLLEEAKRMVEQAIERCD